MFNRKSLLCIALVALILLTGSFVMAQDGEMRPLEGSITIALQGAVPVPGAPLTRTQESWQYVLDRYKELQPNVEVIVEDLPLDASGEQFCSAREAASNFPDISWIDNCSRGNINQNLIDAGSVIATDFAEFEDELNPYSGVPWKDDWINTPYRLERCSGLLGNWTCMTETLQHLGIWMNMDILNEYGYDAMPETYTELFELMNQIDADGTYVSWDSRVASIYWYSWVAFAAVTMDRYEAAGLDLDGDFVTEATKMTVPHRAELWCDKTFWATEHPSIQEGLRLMKKFVDNTPGGGAAFFDPARDDTGQLFLSGRAAFRFDISSFWGSILQAETDGVLGMPRSSIGAAAFPPLHEEDLTDTSQTIYFEGEPALWGGGYGDGWAPIPSMRASGEDENVDLIVRDFLQFLSSPDGQERMLIRGGIPINPVVAAKADPALAPWLTLKPAIYNGYSQTPAAYWANEIVYTADSTLAIQAWLADQIDFETAIQVSAENATRTVVEQLNDTLDRYGLTELPEVCLPYAPAG